MAVSLMISVGAAANVGLSLGRREPDQANVIFGNGFMLSLISKAALSTILGQAGSLICCLGYRKRFRTLKLKQVNLRLQLSIVKKILTLGFSSFLTQWAALVMLIIMNQQTIRYVALSPYGADIPLTVFDIVNKETA